MPSGNSFTGEPANGPPTIHSDHSNGNNTYSKLLSVLIPHPALSSGRDEVIKLKAPHPYSENSDRTASYENDYDGSGKYSIIARITIRPDNLNVR
jgi:hypothetical protein